MAADLRGCTFATTIYGGSRRAEGTAPADEIVACTNGLLYVGTRDLIDHTPAYFSTVSVLFPYDPDSPSPERWLESQRQAIAERLRSRRDVLEGIVRRPPEQHSAIGKVAIGSDGQPVINATAVIAAVHEQLKIERQYRAMFGVDLGTRPGAALSEDQVLTMAKIQVAQTYIRDRATVARARAAARRLCDHESRRAGPRRP